MQTVPITRPLHRCLSVCLCSVCRCPLLQQTITAERSSYSEFDGSAFSDGNQRKVGNQIARHSPVSPVASARLYLSIWYANALPLGVVQSINKLIYCVFPATVWETVRVVCSFTRSGPLFFLAPGLNR